MKPGFDVQRLKIKERTLQPDAETSQLTALPPPIAWGAELPKPAKAGNFVLLRGTIVFERLHVRIIPQKPESAESLFPETEVSEIPDNDPEIRRIFPETEESPYSEPPQPTFAKGDDTCAHGDDTCAHGDVDDYRHSADSAEIKEDLSEQIKSAGFRITCCSIACLFLTLLELLPALGTALPDMLNAAKSPSIYLIINLIMLVFALVLQRSVLKNGVVKLFHGKADGETVVSVASAATLVHICAQLIAVATGGTDLNGDGSGKIFRVFTAALLLTYIINDIALMLLNRRIERNFAAVSGKRQHNAVMLCQDGENYFDLLDAAGRNKSVVYRVKTKFLSDFLRFSYERDDCESKLDRLAPYTLILAVFAAVVGSMTGGSLWSGLTCFCAVAVTAIPACRLFVSAVPLFVAASNLRRRGIMLSGWAAVDEFSNCDTIALSASDIFPNGSVRFVGAKTFTALTRNEIILYAASLAIAAGGTLSDVLDEEIGHKRHLLYPVDSLRYYDECGLEGHVKSRRVLMGTREMMEKNDIEIPGRDHESHMRKSGNHLIYIAVSDRLVGVIAFDYRADGRIEAALDSLKKENFSVMVCTRDPNVTTKLISDTYGISKRHINLLGVRESADYDELTNIIHDRCPAVLSCDRGLASFAAALCTVKKLGVSIKASSLLQIICYVFCIVLVTVLCCMSGGVIEYFSAKLLFPILICTMASFMGIKGAL